jgi:hypothetical protein
VIPEVSGKAAKRCRRSPGSERMAEGGGDQHVRFGAKLVADRLARGKIRLLEPQIFRRWGAPGRSFP